MEAKQSVVNKPEGITKIHQVKNFLDWGISPKNVPQLSPFDHPKQAVNRLTAMPTGIIGQRFPLSDANLPKVNHASGTSEVSSIDELQYLIALTMFDGVGPQMAKSLIAHFGTAKAIFDPRIQKNSKSIQILQRLRNPMLQVEMLRAAEREIQYANKNSVQILSYFDERFPKRLKAISDPPMVLYAKGCLEKLDQVHVAVVGTRRPTQYGRRIAAEFSARFASSGVSVVSGLAYGIDIEAHIASMVAGGQTVAVLGHGIDQVYPREHHGEAQRILETGGLILTEFCTGVGPESYNFPARNRIISGLCDAILVVEANETGGALITAKMAFDQDREVFAIPGCIGMNTSYGCNKLIRDNIARIACSPEDILEEIGHLFKQPVGNQAEKRVQQLPQLSENEEVVFGALEDAILDLNQLLEMTGLSDKVLGSTILGLELKNLVSKTAGNKYQRVAF